MVMAMLTFNIAHNSINLTAQYAEGGGGGGVGVWGIESHND